MISNKSNAVLLLDKIENKDGYLKLYTNLNNFFEIDDKVYICSINSSDTNADLDNYIYYTRNSGSTIQGITYYDIEGDKYLQGYKIIEIDTINNSIVINKPYLDVKYKNKLSSNVFYIAKTYFKSSIITPYNYDISINGCILRQTNIVGDITNNINWKQAIVLGGTISDITINDKYNSSFVSTNTQYINTNNTINSNYTYNNNTYGFNYFNNINTNIIFMNCNIKNGIFQKCNINGTDSVRESDFLTINNGYFNECDINKNNIINNGYFYKTNILTSSIIWNYGIFDPVTTTTIFKPIEWNDGIWNSSNIIKDLQWRNGTFKGDTVETNCIWYNGIFNGKIFNGQSWFNGQFNNGVFKSPTWENGTFNGGTFSSGITSTWKNGIFNDGNFDGNWNNGVFNNGNFDGITWKTGTFNNGVFKGTTWENGIFNNGTFNGNNWLNGNFYNGTFTNSIWYNGNFYNGNMTKSDWHNGNFFYGNLYSVNWYSGHFYNGVSNNSNFTKVFWHNGIFNNGNFGYSVVPKPIIPDSDLIWNDGSFNSGVFWYGTFNNGKFYSGVFNGSWNNSKNNIFYTGDITNAINPPLKPLNVAYVPYLKETVVKKTNTRINPRYLLSSIYNK